MSQVVFQLFTRKNPTEFQELQPDDDQLLEQSDFNSRLPTRIFTHGYNGGPFHSYPCRDEFLTRDDCNFIAVDWTALSTGINYPLISMVNVQLVGQHLASLVDMLVERAAAPIESFHLIGWSLGAHVVGAAGAALRSGQLERITGLDPAWPGYTVNRTDNRLDTGDAKFVDVVHTDGALLTEGGLGFGPAIGHVDFYPNGGEHQPGCTGPIVMTRDDVHVHLGSATGAGRGCDHDRAPAYFAESINALVAFVGVRCDSYDEFLNGTCAGNDVQLMGDLTPTR